MVNKCKECLIIGFSDYIAKISYGSHAQGNTIVLITHDESVANQAERKIRIKDGKVQEVDMNDKTDIQTDDTSKQDLIEAAGKERR